MRFWKYEGLGNDFVIVDGVRSKVEVDTEWAVKVCDRHFGVGADGVLYAFPGEHGCDLTMTVINTDGSEAEMCGNGLRCFARWAVEEGVMDRDEFRVWTKGGEKGITIVRKADGSFDAVAVRMGAPIFDGRKVPVDRDGEVIDRPHECDGVRMNISAVSMGNPHCVTFTPISKEDMLRIAPKMERDPLFPRKTNVEFASVRDGKIYIDVFERGDGWTLACGTGACATTAAAVRLGLVKPDVPVSVHLPGGWLEVTVDADMGGILMKGPATPVFVGDIEW